jgi:hypothetical protein
MLPTNGAHIHSEIFDVNGEPLFKVTAADDPENEHTSHSPSPCWVSIIKQIRKCNKQKSKGATASGPVQFGLTNTTVRDMLLKLSDAESCSNTKTRGKKRELEEEQEEEQEEEEKEEQNEEIPVTPPRKRKKTVNNSKLSSPDQVSSLDKAGSEHETETPKSSKKRHPSRIWTEEEDQIIIEGRKKGESFTEIAKKFVGKTAVQAKSRYGGSLSGKKRKPKSKKRKKRVETVIDEEESNDYTLAQPVVEDVATVSIHDDDTDISDMIECKLQQKWKEKSELLDPSAYPSEEPVVNLSTEELIELRTKHHYLTNSEIFHGLQLCGNNVNTLVQKLEKTMFLKEVRKQVALNTGGVGKHDRMKKHKIQPFIIVSDADGEEEGPPRQFARPKRLRKKKVDVEELESIKPTKRVNTRSKTVAECTATKKFVLRYEPSDESDEDCIVVITDSE